MNTTEIYVYELDNGKVPFVDWFRQLDRIHRAIIRIRLTRVRLGNFGDCESLKDGVFELKIDKGPGYRIYFGKVGNTIVLLLNAGDKSKQSKDIKKAKQYWQDYKEGKNGKSIRMASNID